ncbi:MULTISPECIES: hypothetical protein [unclassified Streptomyces]|uniref:hypothetical protein n=1 Tax=Streptomyces sp. NPDC019208 TaxID=3154683 RepID=UPI0033ADDABB
MAKGLTWQQLADAIGRPLVWTIAALLGQHPLPEDSARQVAELLDLPAEAVPVSPPFRTAAGCPPRCRPIRRSTASMRRCRSTVRP